jgi:hypothetical protein
LSIDVPVGVERAVGGDDRAVDVAQEREGEGMRLEEGAAAERAVRADREEHRTPLVELARDLSQAGQLGRSDAAPVVAVEANHDVAPPKLRPIASRSWAGFSSMAAAGSRTREAGQESLY